MCILFKKIDDVARDSDIPKLQGSTFITDAMKMMDAYKVNIVGVECEKEFAGIFTRGDFTRSVIRQDLNPDETTLYEVMAINTPKIDPDQNIKDAYEMMLSYQREYLPVVDDKKLIGIVCMQDISKQVMKSLEESQLEKQLIINYIQCGESYGMANYEPESLHANIKKI